MNSKPMRLPADAAARRAELLPQVESDPEALLEYAELWLTARYSGSPQCNQLQEPTTGGWLTKLLIVALREQMKGKS